MKLEAKDLMKFKWKLLLKATIDPSLTRSDMKCLAYILERYNKESGSAWPSLERISKDLEISVRHVSRVIKNLKKRKYIKVKSGTRTTSNIYYPNFLLIEGWKTGWCEKPELVTDKAGGTDTHVSRVLTAMSGGVLTAMSDKPLSLEPISLNTHTHRPPDQAQNSGASLQEKNSVCVKNEFLNSEEKQKSNKKRADHGLSTNDQLFINLTMLSLNGKVENKAAYRAKLFKEAKRGELVYSDQDMQDLKYKAYNQIIGNMDSDQSYDLYYEAKNCTEEKIKLKVPGGGEIEIDRHQCIKLLEELTNAESIFERKLEEDIARDKINQSLEAGTKIDEIIQKVSASNAKNRYLYIDILKHDYPAEWVAKHGSNQ